MSRLARVLAIAKVVSIAASLAAVSLAELQSSSGAMACCARSHMRCAGVARPDDCCKRMGHATAADVTATLPSTQSPVAPAAAIVERYPIDRLRKQAAPSFESAFLRPHDPPHLHAFALLI